MSPLSKAGSKTVKPVVLSAVLALLISIPAWGGQYITSIFILIFLYTAIAQMWNLLGGYSGLISLGQQSFVGIGGYALAMASQVYKLPVVWGFAARRRAFGPVRVSHVLSDF
jgi:branched-chain amino acid transport system permease protein